MWRKCKWQHSIATQSSADFIYLFFFIKKTALPECRIFLRVLILILPVLALVEMSLDSKGGPQLERADITMLITVTNRNQKWQMKCAYECVELYSLWKVEAVFIHVHVWVIIYYFVQTVYQACAYHEINFTTLKCSRCECRWSHSQHGCWTVLMTIRLLPCFTPSPSKKTPYCDVITVFQVGSQAQYTCVWLSLDLLRNCRLILTEKEGLFRT